MSHSRRFISKEFGEVNVHFNGGLDGMATVNWDADGETVEATIPAITLVNWLGPVVRALTACSEEFDAADAEIRDVKDTCSTVPEHAVITPAFYSNKAPLILVPLPVAKFEALCREMDEAYLTVVDEFQDQYQPKR